MNLQQTAMDDMNRQATDVPEEMDEDLLKLASVCKNLGISGDAARELSPDQLGYIATCIMTKSMLYDQELKK